MSITFISGVIFGFQLRILNEFPVKMFLSGHKLNTQTEKAKEHANIYRSSGKFLIIRSYFTIVNSKTAGRFVYKQRICNFNIQFRK